MIIRHPNWRTVLIVCIFILLANNALMTLSLVKIQKTQQSSVLHEPLPCKAVPVQFVSEEPECADKLLKSMNISNVRIMPAEDLVSFPPTNGHG